MEFPCLKYYQSGDRTKDNVMLEIAERRVHIDTSLNGCSDYSELTIHKHKITDHNYFTFIQH